MSTSKLVVLNGLLICVLASLWIPGKPVESSIKVYDNWDQPVLIDYQELTIGMGNCLIPFESKEEMNTYITEYYNKAMWMTETFPKYQFHDWLCKDTFYVTYWKDTVGFGVHKPNLNISIDEKADTIR